MNDVSILPGNVVLQPDLTVRFQYVIVEEPGGPVPTPTPTPPGPPAIPEPATLVLLGVGIVGIIGIKNINNTTGAGKEEYL